jgi:hypothetical protein
MTRRPFSIGLRILSILLLIIALYYTYINLRVTTPSAIVFMVTSPKNDFVHIYLESYEINQGEIIIRANGWIDFAGKDTEFISQQAGKEIEIGFGGTAFYAGKQFYLPIIDEKKNRIEIGNAEITETTYKYEPTITPFEEGKESQWPYVAKIVLPKNMTVFTDLKMELHFCAPKLEKDIYIGIETNIQLESERNIRYFYLYVPMDYIILEYPPKTSEINYKDFALKGDLARSHVKIGFESSDFPSTWIHIAERQNWDFTLLLVLISLLAEIIKTIAEI